MTKIYQKRGFSYVCGRDGRISKATVCCDERVESVLLVANDGFSEDASPSNGNGYGLDDPDERKTIDAAIGTNHHG